MTLKHNNVIVTDFQDIANTFLDFFGSTDSYKDSPHYQSGKMRNNTLNPISATYRFCRN